MRKIKLGRQKKRNTNVAATATTTVETKYNNHLKYEARARLSHRVTMANGNNNNIEKNHNYFSDEKQKTKREKK